MSFLLSPMRRNASTVPSLSYRAFSTTKPAQVARMTMVGRLGTDPEVVDTQKGTIIKYVIGTSHGSKDNRQTSWFRVTNFAPESSPGREYVMGLSKGTLVYFEGDAQMRQYEDAEGKKQSSLSLIQTKIEVLKRPTPRDEDSS